MNFNKKKFFDLIQESNKLYQEGRSLWDSDKDKANKLNNYLILLSDDIFWNSRKKYLQILELFVDKKITVDEFMQQFGQLRRSNLKTSKMYEKNLEAEACNILTIEREINFQLNPQSVGFTKIIGSIYASIDLFDPDITLEMNLKHPELLGYGISEEYFRLRIKEDFLPQLVKYCKEK